MIIRFVFFVLLVLAGTANAQDFSQIPAARIYYVAYPDQWVEVPDLGCTLTANKINGGHAGPNSMWSEYTNPRYVENYFIFNDWAGPGCLYDVIYHGGLGGYPDGYIQYDLYGQAAVVPRYRCPVDYGTTAQYNPDGSFSWFCLRPVFSDSKPPGECLAEKNVGNPVSCTTGKKIERVIDATIGSVNIKRTFRSGFSWSGITVPSEFGEGWHSLLTARISYSPATSYVGAVAYAFRSDGTVLPFLKNGSNVWTGEADTLANTLVEAVDGNGEITGWTLTAPDGTNEIYNGDGLLLAVKRDSVPEIVFERTSSGELLSIHDAQGRVATINYDSNGRIDQITLPDGGVVQYGYDTSNRLISVDRMGDGIAYEYVDIPGVQGAYLSAIVDENAVAFAEFGYDQEGKANLTEHANGVDSHAITYSNGGSDVDVVFPGGRTETHAFEVQMGVRKLVSSSMACAGCPAGTATRTYDAFGHADLVTDFGGVVTNFDYSNHGLLTQKVEASNDTTGKKRTTQTDWHATFRVPTERRTYNAANTLVAKSTYAYNTRGQALTASQIDPATSVARTSTTTYCEQTDVTAGTCPLVGLVTSVNGPRTDIADTVSYTYYSSDEISCAASPTTCPHRKGDLWKVTNALGQVTETLAYDGAGRVLSVKDANGVVTDLEYHPRGWLTARKTRGANASVETDDAITQIQYWPTGLVKKVIQPDGAFTSYTYDAAHRLTDISDNAGNTIHYTLDNAGNRTQEDTQDPGNVLKRTLSRVYNQLGQLQTQADAQANPTDFAYDANGNTDTITDALGRITDNNYDPLNRLSRTLQDVGGIGAETQFAYDAQDNLTQVTDPKGLNTTYTYNGLGDLTQLVSPDTGTTTYTYDSAGNRISKLDANDPEPHTYLYDALNRLTSVFYSTTSGGTNPDVQYTYDIVNSECATDETFAKGRLTTARAEATLKYCYDRFGNLTRKVQSIGGKTFVLRYAYTIAGQLQSVTYPDGAVADYVRDAQGRVTEVGVTRAGGTREILLHQASYHPFGPVAGWTYGNGRQLLRPLNQNYQPTAIQDAGVGGLSVGFAYDPVGNLTQLTPAASATPLVKFDYDALSRLTKFKDGPTDVAIESYAYDATGNRQSFTNASGMQVYTYPSTSHRLSQVGTTARTYDAAGNTTSIGGTARVFGYSQADRLSSVKQGGVVTMQYGYNASGERVVSVQPGTPSNPDGSGGTPSVSTYFVYDEAGHWLGNYDNAGAALQQAIWLDDLPVGLIANGNQLHYVEPDHLGTPRVVIEVARNVPVWTWDLKSEAFGNSVPAQDPDGDSNPLVFDMRFPGQRFDATSGLNYNYFRDYDAGTGRYATSDPIGLRGGINTYAYVGDAPIIFMDPLGLQKIAFDFFIFGAGGGVDIYFDYSQSNGFKFDGLGLRGGFGEGAGLGWDPAGQRPDKDILCGDVDRQWNSSLGLYASGSLGIPMLFSFGGDVHGGVRTNSWPDYKQDPGPLFRPYGDYSLPSVEFGPQGRQALSANYNAGVEIIVF